MFDQVGRIAVNPGIIPQAVEAGITYFLQGYNCAESVLLAMSGALGIGSEVIPGMATGFGGGFGRKGSVCGAISGAVMAIGLARGRSSSDDKAAKEEAYALSLLLYRRFEERFGTAFCRDLLEQDLTTPEGRQATIEQRLHETKCMEYIAFTVETGLELLAGSMTLDEEAQRNLDG